MKTLKQLLKDTADKIRTVTETTDTINPQDFEKNLLSFSSNTFTRSMVDFTGKGSTIITNLSIDKSVSIIESYAFNKFGISNIVFEEGLETIKSYAFKDNKTLKYITFSNTLTTLQSSAFDGCIAIEEIILPSSLTEMGAAFTGCTSLASIEVSEGNSVYSSRESNIIFKEEGKILVQGCKNSTIPEDTLTIGAYAFSKIPIGNVIIPESVTSIGNYAFLKSSVKTIKLSSNLTSLGVSAISGTLLSELELPDSLKGLPTYGVGSNTLLKTLTFSKNISLLPVMCCSNCKSLTTVIFPEGSKMKEFGREAFSVCTSLESLTIPATSNPNDTTKTLFRKFDNDVFKGCTKFKTLDLSGLRETIPTLGTGVFTGCHADLKIKVPSGWIERMANLTNWADLVDQEKVEEV